MRTHPLAIGALALAAMCAAANGQTADFRVLAQFSYCTQMSGDGHTVVGVNGSGQQVMWQVGNPTIEVPLSLPAFIEPRGVSFDGSVIAGSVAQLNGVPNIQAYRMENNANPLGLGAFVPPLATSVENILSECFGISDDGSTVVGGARTDSAPPLPDGRRPLEAYRWKNGSMMKLGDLAGGGFASVSRAANPNGSVIVGEGTTAAGAQAWVWRDPASGGAGVLEPLPDLPGGDDFSQAFDVSDDGRVVVGRSGNTASGPNTSVACLWRDGQVIEIGDLPGSDTASVAWGVSGDGAVIVGEGYSDLTPAFGEFEAIYYTEAGGLKNLRVMLSTEYGVDLTGWILFRAVAVSRDGRVICGTGLDPEENFVVWWVELPAPICPADFNDSGSVTVQDIFDFLAAYFGNDPAADFNGVGGVSVQDIFDYLAAYFAGCP